MKKICYILVFILCILLCSCGTSSKSDTEKSQYLSETYDFYETSIATIRDECNVNSQKADEIFIVLVEKCGVNQEFHLIKKAFEDDGYAVSGYPNNLYVIITKGVVVAVYNGYGGQCIYPASESELDNETDSERESAKNNSQNDEQQTDDESFSLPLRNGEVVWNILESDLPKLSGDEIVNQTSPQNQPVLIEGVIDNMDDDILSFDLWIQYGETYYKVENWICKVDLGDITDGSTVEICTETTVDGSLNHEIYAIRKLEVGIDESEVLQNIVASFKNSCAPIDYKGIMRNPSKAYGTICKATGTVFQVVSMEELSQKFLLELDDGNMVYIVYSKDADADNILEEDQVTVYGTFYITETYTSVLGTSKTVPRLYVEYVDLL